MHTCTCRLTCSPFFCVSYFLLDIPYAELMLACEENMARQEKFSDHNNSIMFFLRPCFPPSLMLPLS